ncbi:MAG: hypothetical protein JWL69_2654 [Phycisphaerales bacterium]|nr:hypothetical protein [Phycisphaerales bacterium]
MRRTFRLMLLAMLGVCLAGPAFAADAPAQPERPGLAPGTDLSGRKKIVFLSGHPSHGFAQHEHYAGCMLLAKALNENEPKVYAEVYKYEWPKNPAAFDNAAAIIIYCDGGGGHLALSHLKELDEMLDKGVGLGCIHYGVEPGDEKNNPNGRTEFLKWIGGYFETFFSINPTWKASFTDLPHHPVANGVKPFTTHDEWYYHMRFRNDMQGVTPILSAVPPDNTRQGKDDAHGGNPHIRAAIGKNIAETTVWVAERPHDGRGFGCTGAHYHFNWGSDNFRKTILNAVVWIAHVDVPKDGVQSKTPTPDDLLANLDPKTPDKGFTKEGLQKRIDEMNAGEK